MDSSFKPQSKLFLRFLRYILPYRKDWLVIFIFSGLGALLGVVIPYLTKLFVDRAIAEKNLREFIVLALIAGAVLLLSAIVNGRKEFLEQYIKLKVGYELNKRLFRHIELFPLSWFKDKSTGEHVYKFDYDLEAIVDFITTIPPQAAYLSLRILLTMAVVFYLDWRMAILSVCLAPLLYLPPYYFSRILKKTWEDLIEKSEAILNYLQENFSHIQMIKVFGKESKSIKDYLKRLSDKINIEIKKTRLEIFSSLVASLMNKVAVGLIMFYGGYQVIKGNLSLGSLTAIMVYLTQLMGLQWQFAGFFQNTVRGLLSCGRIARILDEDSKTGAFCDGEKIIIQRGRFLFKNVSFGYRDEENILKDLSFSVEDSSHIALAGPSGCGKTTLLYLLVGLYEPRKGEIVIDGYNVRGLDPGSLKEQIGFALQEPFLFNDSIENNIRYAQEGVSIEEIDRAARLAGVDGFAKNFPLGLRTVIGENACRISEGQKQKIAIARALIKKPKILILDEAMSSIDSEAEERILSNIKENHKQLTLITVSHRLSTLMSADSVFFFLRPDKMVISDAKDLIENNREFSDLFLAQNKILV